MSSTFNADQIVGETKRCLLVKDGDCHLDFIYKYDGSKIGLCCYTHSYNEVDNLGYHLNDDKHKKKGYMSELLPAIIEYLFITKEFKYIKAYTWLENVPSMKLLKRNFLIEKKYCRNTYFKLTREEYLILM